MVPNTISYRFSFSVETKTENRIWEWYQMSPYSFFSKDWSCDPIPSYFSCMLYFAKLKMLRERTSPNTDYIITAYFRLCLSVNIYFHILFPKSKLQMTITSFCSINGWLDGWYWDWTTNFSLVIFLYIAFGAAKC